MSTKYNAIKLRRGTAAEWAASEPQPGGEVLRLGEPGYEKDTRKLKIGDGVTPWNSLAYINSGAAVDEETLQDLLGDGGFLIAGTGIDLVYDDSNDTLTINSIDNPTFNEITINGSDPVAYYVMASIDGNLVTSMDGLNWNGPYNLNINIDHVATDGSTIVTISENELRYTSFSNPSTTTTITATVSGITNIDLNQIIYGGGYFVIAGDGNDGVKTVPVYGYSSDGSNWTFKTVTGSLANTLANDNDENSKFSDIDYNGTGWNFSVVGNETPSGIGGGVYTTDITETFTDGESGNYFGMVAGIQAAWNGNAWYYINSDYGSGFNTSSDPRQGEWDGPYNPWGSSQEDLGINITNNISDTFCGGNGYLVFSDSDGHISFSNDNGQNWTYKTPIPYTATITNISYVDNKYQLVITGGFVSHADGEKIIISGSSVTGYNGTYYLDDENFLYTDYQLITPWAPETEIDPFSGSATVTWSHGQYIDAMDYVNGYFYIGNDDEQIARSTDLINWTIVDDRNGAFDYWNDFNGYTLGGSIVINGDEIIFSDGTIQNSATFKITTIDLHNGGIQNAQVLQFNDATKQSVITGPTPAESGNTSQRLIIQGQRAQGSGEGGDVYMWGGDADINGGDIKIYAGDADGASSGYGGYVNIDAGNGYNQGGSVSISAGNSSEYGGDITINAGYGAISSGVVYIRTGNGATQWEFNNSEALVFPNSSTVAVGTYDNGTSGNGGISLNCTLGYELNWQGGRLKSTYNNGANTNPIYIDSSITYTPTVVSLSFNTTIAVDAKTGEIFDITLTDNITIDNPSNPTDGKTIRFRVTQDGTGGRTIALGTKFVIPSSATSPLAWSTLANKTDIFAATYHAVRDKWDIVAFVPGY